MARSLLHITMLWLNRHLEYVVGTPAGTFTAYKALLLVEPIIAIVTGVLTAVLSAVAVHYVKLYLNRKK